MTNRKKWEGVRSFTIRVAEESLQQPLFRKAFFQEPSPQGPDILKIDNTQEERHCILYPLSPNVIVAMLGRKASQYILTLKVAILPFCG